VDDYSFSKGAGMVMAIQPIENAIETLRKERNYDEIIFTTPDGKLFDQKEANYLSLKKNIILLCGHYKGIDQRVRDLFITKELSIGDYVLTGGELAAAVITDSSGLLVKPPRLYQTCRIQRDKSSRNSVERKRPAY